jgi:hypothetical protein
LTFPVGYRPLDTGEALSQLQVPAYSHHFLSC